MTPCRLRRDNEANICVNMVDVGLYLGLMSYLNFDGGWGVGDQILSVL